MIPDWFHPVHYYRTGRSVSEQVLVAVLLFSPAFATFIDTQAV